MESHSHSEEDDPKAKRKNMLRELSGKPVPTSVFSGEEVKVHTTEGAMIKAAMQSMMEEVGSDDNE